MFCWPYFEVYKLVISGGISCQEDTKLKPFYQIVEDIWYGIFFFFLLSMVVKTNYHPTRSLNADVTFLYFFAARLLILSCEETLACNYLE